MRKLYNDHKTGISDGILIHDIHNVKDDYDSYTWRFTVNFEWTKLNKSLYWPNTNNSKVVMDGRIFAVEPEYNAFN